MKKDPRFQPVDASVTPRFSGIATFMRTQRHEISPELDIALVGAPFDALDFAVCADATVGLFCSCHI